MLERRKYKRFKKKVLITTMYQDETSKMVVEDSIYSEDIGAGGLRLVFPYHIPKGKILDLKVFLFPDPILLPTQGKVVWSDKKQGLELAISDKKEQKEQELFWAGIQFINVDPFSQERILRWIKKEFNVSEV